MDSGQVILTHQELTGSRRFGGQGNGRVPARRLSTCLRSPELAGLAGETIYPQRDEIVSLLNRLMDNCLRLSYDTSALEIRSKGGCACVGETYFHNRSIHNNLR